MTETLLRTKLHIPTPRPNLIARQELVQRLNCGLALQRRLTLVSAPAGFGKTTLLSQWVKKADFTSAWLSLDEEDNQETRFWRYFFAALQGINKGPVENQNFLVQTRKLLDSSAGFDTTHMLTSLINEISLYPQKIIFVLDDYHLIHNHDIHNGMSFLIEHQPEPLHLVIGTRSDPLLPLSKMRASGLLNELRVENLRFSAEEAALFLNEIMGLALSPKNIEALETRTEGWIVGLQLAGLSMQGQQDKENFIKTFTGSHHFILEYLTDEVLRQLPVELKTFLLQTSILKRLCASLCDHVCEIQNSSQVLQDLFHRNLFIIPLDEDLTWFRYHHLFADLLKGQLQQPAEVKAPVLHERAAAWYAKNAYPLDAVRHALAAGNVPLASSVIINNWRRMFHQGRINTAVEWLGSLPQEFVYNSPPLSIALAWTYFLQGDNQKLLTLLEEVLKKFRSQAIDEKIKENISETHIVSHQVRLIQAIAARLHGEVDLAKQIVQETLDGILDNQVLLGEHFIKLAYGSCYIQMANNHLAAGELEQAAEIFIKSIPYSQDAGNIVGACGAAFEVTAIRQVQGRILECENLCRTILKLEEEQNLTSWPAFALVKAVLADILREKRAFQEALGLLEDNLILLQQSGHIFYLAHAFLIKARLFLDMGEHSAALTELKKAQELAAQIQNKELDRCIRIVLDKTKIFSESSKTIGSVNSLPEPLTEREMEVLQLLCEGLSNQEIAANLILALDTVKRHVYNIYGKLGVRRRAQAILKAKELGLV